MRTTKAMLEEENTRLKRELHRNGQYILLLQEKVEWYERVLKLQGRSQDAVIENLGRISEATAHVIADFKLLLMKDRRDR